MAGRRDGDRDPVQENAWWLEVDLYDITDWEKRTVLDAVAAALYRLFTGSGRAVLVLVALLLLVAQLGIILYVIVRKPGLGALTLLSALPAVGLVGFIWWNDPTMREPAVPLAVTFVLAILFASFAALVNTALQPPFALLSPFGISPPLGTVLFFFLVVGPVEETVKWLSVRVFAYNDEAFDAVVDGAVYGAVAGLGFATIENALYITSAVLGSGGIQSIAPLKTAVSTAVTRGFVGPGHVIYSAFAGYYLGLAKYNQQNWGTIVTKGLLVATLIHATYNTIVTYVPFGSLKGGEFSGLTLFIGFILLYDGVFGYVLYRKLSRYRDVYHRATADGGRDEGGGGGDESAEDHVDGDDHVDDDKHR